MYTWSYNQKKKYIQYVIDNQLAGMMRLVTFTTLISTSNILHVRAYCASVFENNNSSAVIQLPGIGDYYTEAAPNFRNFPFPGFLLWARMRLVAFSGAGAAGDLQIFIYPFASEPRSEMRRQQTLFFLPCIRTKE